MENNIKKLLELITSNPDVPIICMVDYDIVGDDSYSRWMAEIGSCKLGEYAAYNEHFYADREEFKEDYYNRNDETLCNRFGYDPWKSPCNGARNHYSPQEIEANDAAEKRLDKYLDEVADRAFTRAIIVYIDTADSFKEFEDEVEV